MKRTAKQQPPASKASDAALVVLVNSAAFADAWSGYEQAIIQEFGTVSPAELLKLHARLVAARDLFEHLTRRYKDG